MKLELEQGSVSTELLNELDFEGFLLRFDENIPLIHRKILKPLTKKEAVDHYATLKNLEIVINDAGHQITDFVKKSAKFPSLESLIPFYKNNSLEQYHLFTLGSFITEDLALQQMEKNIPLTNAKNPCEKIKQILQDHTEKQFSKIIYSEKATELARKIEQFEQNLKKAFLQLEKKIFQQTGLKMIYPYPKEISKVETEFSKIESCNLLQIIDKEDVWQINYQVDEDLKEIIGQKEETSNELTLLMQEKLRKINALLSPFEDEFYHYYQKRKERVFQYSLIQTRQANLMCFPDFNSQSGFHCVSGELSVLKHQNKKNYVQLDIHLTFGSNVLFGANMVGKTTVLKTIFFLATLVKMGLPVPAESIELTFPEQVEIHLKTSGDIRSNLSGFGDEVHFFSQNFSDGAIILVDELFQSTDPMSGKELSDVFLNEYANKKAILFCTSHFPDILSNPKIKLFKMKDPEINLRPPENSSVANQNISFEIKRILPDDIESCLKQSDQALRLALEFPLSDSIKARIRKRLL